MFWHSSKNDVLLSSIPKNPILQKKRNLLPYFSILFRFEVIKIVFSVLIIFTIKRLWQKIVYLLLYTSYSRNTSQILELYLLKLRCVNNFEYCFWWISNRVPMGSFIVPRHISFVWCYEWKSYSCILHE